jgi:dihydrofolate reductase
LNIIIIAAIAQNGIFGDSVKGLPWHIPEEFKHFKETTLGSPVIMGKKTFQELGKPLKGRLNIVLSRNSEPGGNNPDVVYEDSPVAAIKYCRTAGAEKVFIIGGAQVYSASMALATDMILSYLKFPAEGDIMFPVFTSDEWELVSSEEREKFTIHHYSRKH